ncbi:hypothetical protein IGI04_013857 [Brassica rapa subsp. trilocularis]|uniref:Uncharacterized protein n=1 Tax=Brassica rapa subsp. trilocularis TaxID=1813537 RepID=A0ABQ7NA14_BRACM|nr:hypothetical protein IGI04_013857 [Brassica rapa subsp. trilocularis]
MEKISFKSAFIILLAFTSEFKTALSALLMFITSCTPVVISITVQIGEAKRMLQEEKSLPLLDLQVSKLVNPQMVGFCKEPCKPLCFQFSCHCVCPEPPTL